MVPECYTTDSQYPKIVAWINSEKRKINDLYYYSSDKIIRQVFSIPEWIPISIYVFHGVNLRDYETGANYAFKCKCPVFVTRKSQEDYLRDRGIKDAFTVGSLFALYRRLKSIEKAPDAIGTLAFPSHSTELIDAMLDWDDYAQMLVELPEKFQPVSVCMYWKDILADRHKNFQKHGIRVYTAGHYSDVNFVDNFYNIMRNFRYCTGNTIGSHAFYSIDMGIPYFIYGPIPDYDNKDDPNRKKGRYSYTQLENKDIEGIFPEYPTDDIVISEELSIFVKKMIGLDNDIDKQQIRKVIFRSSVHGFNIQLCRPFSWVIGQIINKTPVLLKNPLRKKINNYRAQKVVKAYQLDKSFTIPTHLTNEEKLKLFELAGQKKNGIFVEIGSYYGSSSSIIAAAIDEKARLFCVDTWKNETMPDGEKDTFKTFLSNINQFGNKIIPLRGYSSDVAKTFNEPIDFLFIDGDHSYEAVKSDVDLWFPKLKPNALVIFHDIGWATGVQKVIQEDVSPKVIAEGQLPNMYWAWF
jgi:predicted O-methyltransferase YrrM